jgi:hypothetical protein
MSDVIKVQRCKKLKFSIHNIKKEKHDQSAGIVAELSGGHGMGGTSPF